MLILLSSPSFLLLSTRPKMEISTTEAGNPIRQDIKKGEREGEQVSNIGDESW
jgi:hypothetical protein